jgi:hypothetical protein
LSDETRTGSENQLWGEAGARTATRGRQRVSRREGPLRERGLCLPCLGEGAEFAGPGLSIALKIQGVVKKM